MSQDAAPTAPPAPTGSAGGAARMIPSTLVYVRQDGRTLMLRKARGHQKGKWNGLGGKAEPGEMPEACAIREVREEAGLEVEELDYRGLIVFPRFDGTNDWYVWIYLASAHGEPRAGDEEADFDPQQSVGPKERDDAEDGQRDAEDRLRPAGVEVVAIPNGVVGFHDHER